MSRGGETNKKQQQQQKKQRQTRFQMKLKKKRPRIWEGARGTWEELGVEGETM